VIQPRNALFCPLEQQLESFRLCNFRFFGLLLHGGHFFAHHFTIKLQTVELLF
jgi:hypothetical protein